MYPNICMKLFIQMALLTLVSQNCLYSFFYYIYYIRLFTFIIYIPFIPTLVYLLTIVIVNM